MLERIFSRLTTDSTSAYIANTHACINISWFGKYSRFEDRRAPLYFFQTQDFIAKEYLQQNIQINITRDQNGREKSLTLGVC